MSAAASLQLCWPAIAELAARLLAPYKQLWCDAACCPGHESALETAYC